MTTRKFSSTYGTKTVDTENNDLAIRKPINEDTTFLVRRDGSGDFPSFFQALVRLGREHEINAEVTLDLDPTGDVIYSAEMPAFIGIGKIIINGNGSELQFADGQANAVLDIVNFSPVSIEFNDIILHLGTAVTAKLRVSGVNFHFINVDFCDYTIEMTDCFNLYMIGCRNNDSYRVRLFRCTGVVENNHNLAGSIKNSNLTFRNNTIHRFFEIDSSIVDFDNIKMDYKDFVGVPVKISNSTVRLAGWFTMINMGGTTTNNNPLAFESCVITQMFNNIDIQGGQRAMGSPVVVFNTCSMTNIANPVNLDFSHLTYLNNVPAIMLKNTAYMGTLSITGGEVRRDGLSSFQGSDFDNTGYNVTSTTKEGVIKEILDHLGFLNN